MEHNNDKEPNSKQSIDEADIIDPNERGWKRNVRKSFETLRKEMRRADSGVLHENINKLDKQPCVEDLKFIVHCLRHHFVFYNLLESDLENVVPKMFYSEVKENEYLFRQGDGASSFFIVASGSLEVIINDNYVRTLNKGDGFGELALLYNAPRSASIKAAEHCYLWGIDRHTFRHAVEEQVIQHFEENRRFIEGVTLFNSLTKSQKDSVASVLITQKFNDNQIIVREGDPGSSFYIVKEGTVSVVKEGKEIRELIENDSFGEQVLYNNTVRQATVKAKGNVKCLALSREHLTQILGDQFKSIMYKNLERWALERNRLFSKLTKIQIEKIIENTHLILHKSGDIVYKKDSLGSQKITITIEGAIQKASTHEIVSNRGEAFGDAYLIGPNKNKTLDDDLVMKGEGTVAEISLEAFQQCIGGEIEEILQKNEKSHEKKMMNQVSELKSLGPEIKLDDLIVYKKLGFGQFGSVYLVKPKDMPHFFALKSIGKYQVLEQGLEKYILQEKAVLEVVNFPFIMQMVKTFKDGSHLYFLLEYVKGMELFDVIREIGLLGTIDSQFYIGSMILAIEYLHTQAIMYRDLKPENVMIDYKGYMKLIDLGTAKFLKSATAPGQRTFTIIGTPHYMAPEILSGKGYGLAIDLWSIGVCLYEFMCGMVPFGEEAEDPYEIYEEIITKPIRYPKYLKDMKARALMGQLLSKTPELRLGGSFAILKSNPWFEEFDWDKLHDQEMKSPFVPPEEKLMSDEEMKKMEQLGKKVVHEIEEEEKQTPTKKGKKMSFSENDWDKDF